MRLTSKIQFIFFLTLYGPNTATFWMLFIFEEHPILHTEYFLFPNLKIVKDNIRNIKIIYTNASSSNMNMY